MIDLSTEVFNHDRVVKDSYEMQFVCEYKRYMLSTIRFVDFVDFKQIDLNMFKDLKKKKYKVDKKQLVSFNFIPKKKIVLDRKFESIDVIFENYNSYMLNFYNVAGFNVDMMSFQLNDYIFYGNVVNFLMSDLRFFTNRTHNKPVSSCNEADFQSNVSPLGWMYMLSFNYGTKYSTQTCKYFFKNSRIDYLSFSYVSNSFVVRNMLEFVPNFSSASKLSANVQIYVGSFTAYVYKIPLNNRFLDRDVFKYVQFITVIGELVTIESRLLRTFTDLFVFEISSPNVRSILNRGIGWIRSINSNLNVNFTNRTKIISALNKMKMIVTYQKVTGKNFEGPYLYPDEDFCLFVDFPFNRMVFLDPQTICVKNNCSCTVYWLLRYVHYMNESKETIARLKSDVSWIFPLRFDKYENEIKKCDFTQRIRKCDKNTIHQATSNRMTFDQALDDSQLVDFITVILMPISSILGLAINIVNVRVIVGIKLDKTPEDEKQRSLVRFMLVYSIINLVYCLIHSVSLMNKCVDVNGMFCSDVYFTQFAQWFKIIAVEYMGSCLRTFSNLAYFCISVNRYILLEKESKLAKIVEATLSKMKVKTKVLLIIILVVIIMGLNVHKIVVYKVLSSTMVNILTLEKANFFFSLPFFVANSKIYENYFNYETRDSITVKSTLYEVFTYLNFIFNDLVFFLLFTISDIFLIVSLHQSIEKKKNIFKHRLNDPKVQKQISKLEKVTKNIVKVIVTNTIILLLVKSFDMAISISKFGIWKQNLSKMWNTRKLNSFCYTVKICHVYEELAKIFYIFHYCFSIVAFSFLNKHFGSHLGAIIGCCCFCCRKKPQKKQ